MTPGRLSMAAALVALTAVPARAGDFTLRQVPETAMASPAEVATPAAGAFSGDAEGSAPATPSVRRAILYSLILPGWGDAYAGRPNRARIFFMAEAAVWTSFAVFRLEGRSAENDYKQFAVQFAGVTRTDHSDAYYGEIRSWDSSADYEAFLKSQGRASQWPNGGSTALDRYFEANRLADYEPWQWTSLDRRLQYQSLRSQSKNAYRRSMYAVAAAAANRVVAAIFSMQAVRSARADERAERSERGRYLIDFSPPLRYAADMDAAVSLVRTF